MLKMYWYLYQFEKVTRQMGGRGKAMPCPLEYIDVSQILFELVFSQRCESEKFNDGYTPNRYFTQISAKLPEKLILI